MKIGVTIQPFEGVAASNLIPFAKTISLDHVEINVYSMPEVNEIIPQLDKLTTTFHLPIKWVEGYEPGSKDKKSQEQIKKTISFINENHQDLNMLYTLSHPPEADNADLDLLLDNLEQINTPIILENIPWQKDEEFIEFYNKAKDRLGKHLAGHAIDGPHRFLTYGDRWLEVPKILENDIVYVHLQDTFKDNDTHLPLGQGEMPYQDFIKYLRKIGYKGVINQEIKPKGLDLISIMNSCLEILKISSKARYLRMKLKYAILVPILKRKIAKAVANK